MTAARSTGRRFGTVLLLVMGLLVATLAPAALAGQGKPIIREKSTFADPLARDDFLSDVCGIEVYVEGSGRDTVNVYPDGSTVVHFGSTFVLHSPDTGETLYRKEAAKFRAAPETEVFDPEAETLTISWDETFTGLPAKWSKRGEGVLLRDAGWVRFQGTVVLDVSGPEPEEVSFEEIVTVRGPHPELETDVLAFICDALGA